ncbi:DUF3793 family protein [Serpentinicella alkaliphila]|uniref:Uncharacterized protein DUF3793 n=1 Tax=Serpentinicella alkaliphila TaxID=1734049 RepID=A0A4R2TI21_9FIRM|nr:DUF3793 family protein [Serpentinicella alkaliphila]QUH26471.1 DUF3793 family protein [Serpentinicella alkaliphila]TCQ03250.1 uncharacterized protein DUF3793 [Serpentinicella alkaliphila]
MNLANCYCNLKDKTKYNKWIVEQLGPVLLGVKPAEILSFPTYNSLNDFQELIDMLFKINNQVGFVVIYPPEACMKILFYNRKILDETLMDNRVIKFLRKIGYPENYSLNNYLNLLTNKLRDGEMPHEIGVFLGYPLKDVIGFIGHPSLKLTKVNRWRVYGHTKVSDVISQRILAAKKQIKEQLNRFDCDKAKENYSIDEKYNIAHYEYYLILLAYFLFN